MQLISNQGINMRWTGKIGALLGLGRFEDALSAAETNSLGRYSCHQNDCGDVNCAGQIIEALWQRGNMLKISNEYLFRFKK
jgi:hypothetical protein